MERGFKELHQKSPCFKNSAHHFCGAFGLAFIYLVVLVGFFVAVVLLL